MIGYVASDLHMYSRRSLANACEPVIDQALEKADFLVLNGDLVDFKWSTIGGLTETIDASADWLTALSHKHPKCTIHYVLGNHDALTPHAVRMQSLSRDLPSFFWHPTHVQLGSALFHHGDLLLSPNHDRHWHRPMHDAIGVKGSIRNLIYDAAIAARLHRIPELLNQPNRISRRIVHALQASTDPEHALVTDVYVGHTHTPFNSCEINGIRVHNTGSTIKHLAFNMLCVDLTANQAELHQ